jgi:hypothetical protein
MGADMVRTVLVGLAFSAGFALSASAADDVMAGFYGNTTVSTGGVAEVHTVYSADHTFMMSVPAFGMQFKGTWALNGSTLCRTFETAPPGQPNPLCTPVAAHKVGDTWTVTNGNETRNVTLVKGVQ